MKCRIIKRSCISYGELYPKRREWFVIQHRYCFFWFDMHFNNYPDSIMTFDNLSKAKKYLKNIGELKNVQA